MSEHVAEFKIYRCNRCAWTWHPKRPMPPKVCPNCKRKDWNLEPQGRDAKEG